MQADNKPLNITELTQADQEKLDDVSGGKYGGDDHQYAFYNPQFMAMMWPTNEEQVRAVLKDRQDMVLVRRAVGEWEIADPIEE